MSSQEISTSMQRVFMELRNAETEMSRPSEDVVAMSVCAIARRSMIAMMRLYLWSNAKENHESSSIDDVVAQCIAVDHQFSEIDFSSIFCRGLNHSACKDKHCFTADKVNECLAVANKVKKLVQKKMNIND